MSQHPSSTPLRLRRRASLSCLALCIAMLVAACASPVPAQAGQVREFELQQGGSQRSYRVYQPASYNGRPLALVVALHGGLGTGKIMQDQSGFDAQADRHGFLVAYPDGIGRGWNAGSCCGKPMEQGVDDVAFVRGVIAQVRKDYAVSAKVYGTGFSNGAMLLHRIACEAPDTFAAIAPVSGGLMMKTCAAKTGVPALLIQGRADKRIPWDGGVFDDTYRPSIQELVTGLGQRNGCGTEQVSVKQTGEASCQQLKGCAREVSWCGLEGVGHQWAGGQTFLPRFLGANAKSFDASAEIAAFFQRH